MRFKLSGELAVDILEHGYGPEGSTHLLERVNPWAQGP